MLLAEAGCRIALRSSRGVAMDAHPGFREQLRRRLIEGGHSILENGSEAEGAWEIILYGRDITLDTNSFSAWRGVSTRIYDALLDDAYEPNMLTRGVYAAALIALNTAKIE